MRLNTERNNDIMSDKTRGDRAIIHSHDRHRIILETMQEPVAIYKQNRDTGLVHSTIYESICRDGFSVGKLESDVNEKKSRQEQITHNMSREMESRGTSRLEGPHTAVKVDMHQSPACGCLSPLCHQELQDLAISAPG